MDKRQFLRFLESGDFASLFIEAGWNRPASNIPFSCEIGAENKSFVFKEIAELYVRVLVCETDSMPLTAERNALDTRLRKRYDAYIVIFIHKGTRMHHLWMVPVKSADKRSLVRIEYQESSQADFLYGKFQELQFPIGEVPDAMDVLDRLNHVFKINAADVTKKFYKEFRQKHSAFVKGILNIMDKSDCEWYASVMLNRLMFCYFIQKKGFLDLDQDYLSHKLAYVQQKKGEDQFYGTFYKDFLRVLFADGLNKREHSAEFEEKFGRIPYLNGGMFEVHKLEKKYPDIDIPDSVFEDLFAFFDQWRWHLDTSLTATGRDINPDVLGYIFEQYINDRAQMGAYYTKEDITEYIARNTIVPWLFNETEKKSPDAFRTNGAVWQTLRESHDNYIFPAVRKGVDKPLPDEIEIGVAVEPQETLRARRAEWNKPADDDLALPTEIWRETVARRQRCLEVRNNIASGGITDINDFITYNLDIRKFAENLLTQTTDHLFVRHFYDALCRVTILDPTCGSGAFLFAALNILEPLYEICLTRMQEDWPNYFKEELFDLKTKYRGNLKYCIYKNIILRNLYGVDIMREATEIARLRLFLKMVAVVDVDEMADNLGLDPLPDIDFNIRCGNTLVGFANPEEVKEAILMQKTQQLMLVFEEDLKPYKRIENKAADIADLYERFKSLQQTAEGSSDFYEAKKQLNEKLVDLNVELDRAMARRFYGIDSDTLKGNMEFVEWKKKTQPFHWYSEFYDITVANGGFDVIIGNPPYVSMRKIDYLRNSDHFACSDLFGHVIKRVLSLMNNHSRHGFIVMHNIAFSNDFKDVRHELINNPSRSLWCTFYARIPSGLFTVDGDGGARVRNCIYITAELGGERYTSRLRRWFTEYRSALFQDICYVRFFNNDVFPMFNSNALQVFLTDNERKIFSQCIFLNKTKLYYQATGYNYLSVTRKPAPCYNDNVEIEGASKDIEVSTDDINIYSLLFNGKITLSRWLTYGDDFHVTLRPFMDSRVNFEHISQTDKVKINKLYEEFERRLPETLQFKLNCGKRIGSYNISKLWDITDQSDAILLKYLCNNPEQILEAIEDHISSCVISNRKENATE